jgi:hypothetical protein
MEGDGGRGTSRGRQAGWSRSGIARAGRSGSRGGEAIVGAGMDRETCAGGSAPAPRGGQKVEEPARSGAGRTGAQRTNTMRVALGAWAPHVRSAHSPPPASPGRQGLRLRLRQRRRHASCCLQLQRSRQHHA